MKQLPKYIRELRKHPSNIKKGFCVDCGKKLSKKKYIYCKICTELGERNHTWVGDAVGIQGVHGWIKKRLIKPKKCSACNKETKNIDLANISQKYLRKFSDWEWLCRSCHMNKDGRLERLHELRHKRSTEKFLTNLRKELTDSWGKKCKDFEFSCTVCRIHLALEIIEYQYNDIMDV